MTTQEAITMLKELKGWLEIHHRVETMDGISAINTVVEFHEENPCIPCQYYE